ncbi:tripartite tricarboxylate transporter substrate binding protein [Alkalihalobacillus oceani]|uniref:tripartite tricarboxylate transporter substrate binding protein n=1 Tax=Halalkalibacter oceani TaxID=1653776 RepID=UPI00203B974A|nr:tripartite tricarboxylate transporter substrate binding protein [Halalkalibacter oceani]MCM3762170.1 tripartite tricarboxylate transporter substrate binding protein [Halalkalibacter oceani]
MKRFLLLVMMLIVMGMIAACGSDETSQEGEGTAEGAGAEGEGETAEFVPSGPLDWTIAFGPGGGNDVMARSMINIIEQYELYPESIVPENREGGSGAVGWGYLMGKAGSDSDISTTSGSFITTPLQSDPGWTYEDFTHIALMATDDMFLVVPGNSEFETLEDFVEHAKANRLNFGGIGVANVDRMVVATLAKEAGIENYEYIPYDDTGLQLADMLAGTLDAVVSNPGDVLGQLEAGELKALAFSGQERLPGQFEDIPTFIESGLDVNISMPRGVILPPDVPEEVRQYWIDTMKQIAETPEWQEYIEKNHLSEYILYGDDFSNYLEETVSTFEEILIELGVIG